jgi:type VI secretion system secreted protein VgrG
MSIASQKFRDIAVRSPAVPPDTLLLRGMKGTEALGRPFAFRLDMVSADAGIDPARLLGKEISVMLKTAGGGREFNGIVSAFSTAGTAPVPGRPDPWARYGAVVRPRLWRLALSSHCRFFHDMSALDIARQLLDDHQVAYRVACTARYPKLEHCAQYRESDLDFFGRLLEREGIYYYFQHAKGTDTVVLADSPQAHDVLPGCESIPFSPLLTGRSAQRDAVYRWKSHAEMAPGSSQVNAFDFKNVKGSLSQSLIARATAEGDAPGSIEDYALLYDSRSDGRRFAQARLDACRVRSRRVRARATARGIAPGGWFRMTGHPRADQNAAYLVTAATWRLCGDAYASTERNPQDPRQVYDCDFTAVPRDCAWRPMPAAPLPRAGLQTAVVIAADGDEMATDPYGRVKVQFHWEQFNPPEAGKRMQRCWVRVAQGWAGKGWGSLFVPRAGQEVVVAFLDGDPDHPLVVGSLYNGGNRAPYTLPANQGISTIRTDSLGPGKKDRNEIRFDDKALQLLLYTGGRFDTYTRKSAFAWVGENEHRTVAGQQRLKAASQHITVTENQNVKVGGIASLEAAENVVHQAGVRYIVNGEVVHVKGGAEVVVEAGEMLTLKAGGSFITLDPAGVQISGALVGLNSGGAAAVAPGASPVAPEAPEQADDGSKVK